MIIVFVLFLNVLCINVHSPTEKQYSKRTTTSEREVFSYQFSFKLNGNLAPQAIVLRV